MKSDDLRSLFLSFFEEKGHKVIPSSSLIPVGDPTLLLTNAGMVQVKPYFLGEQVPPSRRLASCQKCFRTSDIEEVGDATHLTFFEMLGNFSVGDYFKKETIAWAWEFVTEHLKLPPEKLWITIFLDDDEAFDIWRQIGIPAAKIVRFGEEDNFWGPAGSSGPCGPDSEIHYDLGEDKGCGEPDCKPNCKCGRFTEIWNLVFTQYNQDEKGNRTPLPRPNIDTGMGLDRVVALMQDKKSVYDTDLFTPLLDSISKLTGKKYGDVAEDVMAMRVVADHARALAFLIADGVLPDNEGRGYVLRRLLRRGALFGRRLGLDKPFLSTIAETAIKKMGHVYPELNQRRDFIKKVVEMEEARFEETLNTGLELLVRNMFEAIQIANTIVEKSKTPEMIELKQSIQKMLSSYDQIQKSFTPMISTLAQPIQKIAEKTQNIELIQALKISGTDAFKLYDTYGFPVELTKEIVSKQGFSVDMPAFEKEMEKQRDRARASHKFDISAGASAAKLDVPATDFVGYTCLEQKATVVKLLVDGQEAGSIQAGQSAGVVLDTTPFYAEMGGQVGDTGDIVSAEGKFSVTGAVRLRPDVIVHQGKLTSGSVKVGDLVNALVDVERRRDIARNHTATHLLQAALREVLGSHIQQRGSLVAPDRLRFDFSHLSAMTTDEIKAVQHIVNERVRQNIRVYDEESDYKQAVASGAIALFDEKYGDEVRVMRIGEPAVSAELCGGTHVSATGEIGYFHILSEGSIGSGLRRIEAVAGRAAEALVEQHLGSLHDIALSLETTPDKLKDKVTEIVSRMEEQQKRSLSLEKTLARAEADSLLGRVEEVKGVKVLAARVSPDNPAVLREMADFLRDKLSSAIIVLGAVSGERPMFVAAVTPDLVSRGYSAGNIIKQVSKITGGGGGGKADFAQAGGRDKSRLDEALRLVRDLI